MAKHTTTVTLAILLFLAASLPSLHGVLADDSEQQEQDQQQQQQAAQNHPEEELPPPMDLSAYLVERRLVQRSSEAPTFVNAPQTTLAEGTNPTQYSVILGVASDWKSFHGPLGTATRDTWVRSLLSLNEGFHVVFFVGYCGGNEPGLYHVYDVDMVCLNTTDGYPVRLVRALR